MSCKWLCWSSSPLLAIDISLTSLKLLALSRIGKQFRIKHCAMQALGAGSIVQGLQNILQTIALKRARVAIALADAVVSKRIIQMDASLSDQDVAEQLMRDSDNYFSLPMSDVLFDFCILGPATDAERVQDVLLFVVQLDKISHYLNAFEQTGLELCIVDIASHAIKRACHFMQPALLNDMEQEINISAHLINSVCKKQCSDWEEVSSWLICCGLAMRAFEGGKCM